MSNTKHLPFIEDHYTYKSNELANIESDKPPASLQEKATELLVPSSGSRNELANTESDKLPASLQEKATEISVPSSGSRKDRVGARHDPYCCSPTREVYTPGSARGTTPTGLSEHALRKGLAPFRKTHFRAKRMLALIAILIVLILVVKALSTIFANEDVTAFRVGARASVPLYIGGGGIIYPRQQIPVSYAAAGHITNVIVKVGDQVKAGQPLVTLDQSQVNAQINLAANTVAAAQAYLNSVSNTTPYNPITVANAQQQLQIAQNRYSALISQSSNELDNGNLLAPATGMVSAINVTPGQNFAAQAVLLTLIDPSVVTVHAEIPLENLSQVHNGMSAIVNPSALPNESVTGKVTSIVPQANPQTDTFEAYIEIANSQQELLPGMSAFVRIQSQTNAFVVPQLAVLNPDRESAVFEIRNNHAYTTNVHVIGRSDNFIYIDQGLSPNDLIVLLPLDSIHEGQHVNITHLENPPNGIPS